MQSNLLYPLWESHQFINVLPCPLIFPLSLSLRLLLAFSLLLTFPSPICLAVSFFMMFGMGAILAGSA